MLFASMLVAMIACGGGSSEEAPPKPLERHFDDKYIVQIPMEQQQDVVSSESAWSVAKRENAKHEADISEFETTLQVVRNDAKTAHTGVESAVALKKTAQASNDMNKINQATKDERIAEDLAKAADERVHYFEAYKKYLVAEQRLSLEMMYWREAQYEVAKSTVAQKAGKAIANVKYEWYPSQEQERGKRTQHWRDKAEQAKQGAMGARGKWLDIQKNADTENGHAAAYSTPDPLAAPPTASDGGNPPAQ